MGTVVYLPGSEYPTKKAPLADTLGGEVAQ